MTFPNFISKTWNLPWSISVYQSLNLDMTGLVKQVTQVATLLFDFLFISDSLGCLLWWWLWWWSVEIHTSSSFLSFKAPSSQEAEQISSFWTGGHFRADALHKIQICWTNWSVTYSCRWNFICTKGKKMPKNLQHLKVFFDARLGS